MEAILQPEVTVDEQVEQLRQLRNDYQAKKTMIDVLLTDVREKHADIFDKEAELKTAITTLESDIRAQALELYAKSKEKYICPGLGIKVTKQYSYDTDKALEWAKENAKVCIVPESLNASAFKDICKSDKTRPAFVTVDETPTTTLSPDLNKVLGGA